MWARFYILIYQTFSKRSHKYYLKYPYLLNIPLNYVLFAFNIVKYNNSLYSPLHKEKSLML